jgi:hypothetical protein
MDFVQSLSYYTQYYGWYDCRMNLASAKSVIYNIITQKGLTVCSEIKPGRVP